MAEKILRSKYFANSHAYSVIFYEDSASLYCTVHLLAADCTVTTKVVIFP